MSFVKPSLIPFLFLVAITGCSDESPEPKAPTKALTEIEKVICGSNSKTWKLKAIYQGSSNVIKACAVNDSWTFYYSRTLQIKNTDEACDGHDLYQKHAWNVSADQRNIFMSTSVFTIVKMTTFEIRLQEKSQGDPVFVLKP